MCVCVCVCVCVCRYGEQAGNVTAESLEAGKNVAKLTYVRYKLTRPYPCIIHVLVHVHVDLI